jgi:hypothetical protein
MFQADVSYDLRSDFSQESGDASMRSAENSDNSMLSLAPVESPLDPSQRLPLAMFSAEIELL